MKLSCFAANAALISALFVSTSARGENWSGWMGNHRDGVYSESDLIDEIPKNGLKVKWRTPVGGGYAGPAVADGRVFVFDYQKSSGDVVNDPGTRATLQGQERLHAIDEKTGDVIWTHAYNCPYSISYPVGPRCTPTVDGDRVYNLGSEGNLKCLGVRDGNVIWERNLKSEFGADVPIWGFSAHPLVDGDLLYCMVGGTGQCVVAFDKLTGKVRWKALDSPAGYCPPSIITAAGVRQLMIYTPDGVSSLNPADGSVLWTVGITPQYEMSINRPVIDGDRMYVSGIGSESVMLQLNDDAPGAEVLWRGERNSALYTANSTPLFVDGIVLGTDCHDGSLIAVDSSTGDRLWESFLPTAPNATERQKKVGVKHGTAFLTKIGDANRYLLFSETGHLILADMDAQGYTERGRFKALEPTSECFGRKVVWSHPAYANQTAFARNDQEVVAIDLAKR
ncbi:MAG: PQQ-binding-like beta-propeller repeat protein [Planctomycetota bacterium]